MQVRLAPLMDSTTGHYNSIGLHSSSLWSAFLARVQQGRALERAFVALNSMGMHCHAYRKYTGSPNYIQWCSYNIKNTDLSKFVFATYRYLTVIISNSKVCGIVPIVQRKQI